MFLTLKKIKGRGGRLLYQNNIGGFLIDWTFALKELHFILLLLITLELDVACCKLVCNSKACSETVHITGLTDLETS